MTPKEKAKELVDKFYPLADGMGSMEKFYDEVCFENQKKCALIAVDEIIRLSERADLFLMKTKHQLLAGFKPTENYMEYWVEVKKEIDSL